MVLALATGSYKAGFGSVLLLYLDLVAPMTHIHDREVALALKGRQDAVRTRKRLLRDYNVLINLSMVATQLSSLRGLLHHDHR